MEVLLEESVEIDGIQYMTGHSKEYIRVIVPSEDLQANQIIKVKSLGTIIEDFMNCERID